MKKKKPTKPEQHLTNPVQVNFTDDQKEKVVAAANAAGMGLATFIRMASIAAAGKD